MRNRFHRMLSLRGTNLRACSASGKMWTVFACTIHAEHTRNEYYRTLSIPETNFIACWAYAESISSHAEHARKCLKVEYLGRIEYDFQESRVTGPWDHKVSVSEKKSKKYHACVPLRRKNVLYLVCGWLSWKRVGQLLQGCPEFESRLGTLAAVIYWATNDIDEREGSRVRRIRNFFYLLRSES